MRPGCASVCYRRNARRPYGSTMLLCHGRVIHRPANPTCQREKVATRTNAALNATSAALERQSPAHTCGTGHRWTQARLCAKKRRAHRLQAQPPGPRCGSWPAATKSSSAALSDATNLLAAARPRASRPQRPQAMRHDVSPRGGIGPKSRCKSCTPARAPPGRSPGRSPAHGARPPRRASPRTGSGRF